MSHNGRAAHGKAKAATSKTLDLALASGGMAALLLGRKVIALSMFARGLYGLERHWRAEHPEFKGDWEARWRRAEEFYEATHQHPVNRFLHVVGIPMIVGGAVGLLAFKPYRPLWFGSAAWFGVGWGLNFIGHGVFEKKAPAFADDPLSFLAGPVWDAKQLQARFSGQAPPAAPRTEPREVVVDAHVRTTA